MSEFYVILVNSKYCGHVNEVCYDSFGRNPFIGSLAQAQALKAEMDAMEYDATYTIYKLEEI